jgi:hypothetical protein
LGNRRTQLVELTPEGLEVLSQIYQRQVQWSSRILEPLHLDMLRDLSTALTDIAAVLRRDLEIDRDDRNSRRRNRDEPPPGTRRRC